MITVRLATTNDAPALARISNEIHAMHVAGRPSDFKAAGDGDVFTADRMRSLIGAPGHFVGAYLVNLIIAELLFAGGLLVWMLSVWPDVPWDAVQYVAVAAMAIAPLALYPFTRSIWLAADLIIDPLRPSDR